MLILAARNIGFIGGGNMAQSLIGGLIDAGHDAARLAASDPVAGCRAAI
ncbi:MAG: NAD(P)-binding domain-containing protein, partial [Gammaproteobacteria bacterium]|nr:NAD(P)-binding domain-containing protein [Gammaproteobacteria bacterium]